MIRNGGVRNAVAKQSTTHVRYIIILVLFVASTFSYGDRVVLSIAADTLTRDLQLNPVRLGYLLSGFGWAYAIAQLPAGSLLDRFGSRRVYGLSILCWSALALLAGFAGSLPVSIAFDALFLLRLLSGLAQSPVFPGNGRIVAAWFPTSERGRASALFNASQYFSLVFFAPIMGWIDHFWGWRQCFWFTAIAGFLLAIVWSRSVYGVRQHPHISPGEVQLIEHGGGLVTVDANVKRKESRLITWSAVRQLLGSRMMIGIYIGQYCITTLTWFFLTWFPIYLTRARHIPVVRADSWLRFQRCAA